MAILFLISYRRAHTHTHAATLVSLRAVQALMNPTTLQVACKAREQYIGQCVNNLGVAGFVSPSTPSSLNIMGLGSGPGVQV